MRAVLVVGGVRYRARPASPVPVCRGAEPPWQSAGRSLGIDAGNPETNAVILEGRAYFKSDATIRVLASLPGWWWLRPLLLLLPRPLRDRAYDWIARNRYRLFGRRESCLVAAPELARRVVFDEPPAG
jgi:predicted DCC family thiol-disulfide oxidoreductase YuxK